MIMYNIDGHTGYITKRVLKHCLRVPDMHAAALCYKLHSRVAHIDGSYLETRLAERGRSYTLQNRAKRYRLGQRLRGADSMWDFRIDEFAVGSIL